MTGRFGELTLGGLQSRDRKLSQLIAKVTDSSNLQMEQGPSLQKGVFRAPVSLNGAGTENED